MKGRTLTTVVVALLIFAAGYAALFIAPEERTMHAIQRIFYMHVAAWVAMYVAFTTVFYANVRYLVSHNRKWDALGVSAAEVGVLCCSIGLTTGPLWAKPVWGIWWTWDARLTSTFVLWLLYVSYLILRGLLEDPEKKATLSAVFGIFASLDMPLVYVSNRLWRTQHPQPVILGGSGSGLQTTMLYTLFLCMIAVTAVMVIVLLDRYKLELMRNELAELRFAADRRPSMAGGQGALGTARG
ncbi:MAG: cytochrome c biogenesis protein CcsA [Candidatus Acidiferrales bacterium]